MSLAPSLGGVLYGIGGFYLPFVVTGAGYLIIGFLTMRMLPASLDQPDDLKKKTTSNTMSVESTVA